MTGAGVVGRVPPGRAGRNWLRRRLAAAARGREQLDRKLRVLLPEQRRARTLARARDDELHRACDEARLWLDRAALLGGEDALRRAAEPSPAVVEVAWRSRMGLTYPVEARLGPVPPRSPLAGTAALHPARAAALAVTAAGARAAVAQEAVRRVDGEVALTRRRLRALDTVLLPGLRAALHDLDLALEQQEQEDAARLRLATGTDGDRPSPRRPVPGGAAGPVGRDP